MSFESPPFSRRCETGGRQNFKKGANIRHKAEDSQGSWQRLERGSASVRLLCATLKKKKKEAKETFFFGTWAVRPCLNPSF